MSRPRRLKGWADAPHPALPLLTLTTGAWLTLFVVLAVTVAMYLNLLGPELVMFCGLCVLVVCGVIEPSEALVGFANPAVATIGVLFVCAAAVQETGGLARLSQAVFGGTSSVRGGLLRLVLPTAFLSAFMNNTPIVAMFIPMVRRYAERIGSAPSIFLIPLSYAAMLGGTCTLIGTSANLVVAGLHAEQGYGELGMLDITWIGVPITAMALGYLVFAAPALLAPRRDPALVAHDEQREYLAEVEVAADAPMVGQTIEEAGLRSLPNLFLVEIRRSGGQIVRPVGPRDRLEPGDHLVLTGIASSVTDLTQLPGLSAATEAGLGDERGLFEVVVSHRSPLVGQSVKQAEFRRRYSAAILAVHRAGERIEQKIGDIVLRPGDTLMLVASPGFRRAWQDSTAFYLVSDVSADSPPQYQKANLVFVALLAMVLVPSLTDLTLLHSAMGVLVFLLATRCISTRAARQAVNWPVLVLIGSAIGISGAMKHTGAASAIAAVLLEVTAPLGPVGLLAGVWVLGAVFASAISNAAAAALVFPVAMDAALYAGADTRTVALALALSASAGFSSPIGSSPNLLVWGPGGYLYSDYMRIGLPLTLLCLVGTMLLLPAIWAL